MSVSLRLARRATTTALAVSIAAAGLVTSACSPAQVNGTKVISGTVQGADGKIVDVLIGYDVLDGAGHKLNLGAGNVGYSAIQRLNHCVGTSGASGSQKCPNSGQITGYNWSLVVPSSAQTVYVEVYPKAPTASNWVNNYKGYTGVAAGSTNTSTYSTSYVRAVPLASSRGGIKIILPKVCGLSGGSTGSLYGHIPGWANGNTGKVTAWSMAPNWLPTQGFGGGTVDANGNYRINGLQAGQRYGLIASGGGRSFNVVNYKNSNTNDTLIPSACSQKNYNFN